MTGTPMTGPATARVDERRRFRSGPAVPTALLPIFLYNDAGAAEVNGLVGGHGSPPLREEHGRTRTHTDGETDDPNGASFRGRAWEPRPGAAVESAR
jgi:hypothetical protein